MKITLLGTGTSTGVPQLGCTCPTCLSGDPRDRRRRASALVTTDQGTHILIDAGPDIYHQLLDAKVSRIDAVLLTHSHFDHMGGMDDLRPYCPKDGSGMPVYCLESTASNFRQYMPYCFAANPYPGVPHFDVHIIDSTQFKIGHTPVEPVKVMHGQLEIRGYKIGKMAYVTDCKTLPEESMRQLEGLDLLVINALRQKEHWTHMNLEQALKVISQVKPRRAVLTHLSHDMGLQADVSATLPMGVEIGVDGVTITV